MLSQWSAFSGDGGGFFAVMSGLMMHTHTYQNILREGEFCINFLDISKYDACIGTIGIESAEDELAVGLTAEPATLVAPPRIQEAFLSFECKLHSDSDLSGTGVSSLVIGKVVNAAIEDAHDRAELLCGDNGFMYYISAPMNPQTGQLRQERGGHLAGCQGRMTAQATVDARCGLRCEGCAGKASHGCGAK